MESINTYDMYKESMTHEHTMIKATATWCGPCKRIHPKVVELAKNPKYENIKFYEYDIDAIDDCPLQGHIRVVPTFLFFEKNNLVHKVKGGDILSVVKYLDSIVSQVSKQESENLEKSGSSSSNYSDDSSEGSE